MCTCKPAAAQLSTTGCRLSPSCLQGLCSLHALYSPLNSQSPPHLKRSHRSSTHPHGTYRHPAHSCTTTCISKPPPPGLLRLSRPGSHRCSTNNFSLFLSSPFHHLSAPSTSYPVSSFPSIPFFYHYSPRRRPIRHQQGVCVLVQCPR